MAPKMTSLWQTESGTFYFRKRVPNRLRPFVKCTILYRSLRTKDPTEAKRLFVAKAAEIAEEWDVYERYVERKAAVDAQRVELTQKQIQGLAGEFYRWYVAQHDGDPGTPDKWERKIKRDEFLKIPKRRPGALLADYLNEVRRFLEARDIVIPDTGLIPLARAAIRAGGFANEILLANANKKYPRKRILEIEDEFPKWEEVEPTLPLAKEPLTVENDFDACAAASGWGAGTVPSYRRMLVKLGEHMGAADLSGVTEADLQSWKKALLAEGIGAGTIKNGYLAAVRSFYGWAVTEGRLKKNPAEKITIRVPKKSRTRSPAFSDDEAALILSETLREPDPRVGREFADALRWVPWLMAYSGARVNEITQLHREDFYWRTIGDERVFVMRLTPKAGRRIKTGEARDVPVHPHLVEQGFHRFVEGKRAGPLFVDPTKRRKGDEARPQNHKVADKMAEWVRVIGVEDEDIQPNHAWRHRFNRVARIVGMNPEVRDAIEGHAPRTEGEKYGADMPLDPMWAAIKMLPRFAVAPPVGPRPVTEAAKRASQKRMETAKRAKERKSLPGQKTRRPKPAPTEAQTEDS